MYESPSGWILQIGISLLELGGTVPTVLTKGMIFMVQDLTGFRILDVFVARVGALIEVRHLTDQFAELLTEVPAGHAPCESTAVTSRPGWERSVTQRSLW